MVRRGASGGRLGGSPPFADFGWGGGRFEPTSDTAREGAKTSADTTEEALIVERVLGEHGGNDPLIPNVPGRGRRVIAGLVGPAGVHMPPVSP